MYRRTGSEHPQLLQPVVLGVRDGTGAELLRRPYFEANPLRLANDYITEVVADGGRGNQSANG